MLTSNPAPTDHDIHELIANRWSPLALSDEALDESIVNSLLEAARWAASSYNEQPWQYVLGYKGDAVHEKLAECLLEGNSWAKEAPVLMLSVAKTFFEHKHKPNRHCMHDLGAASAQMHLQAVALGLAFHQMAGFDLEKARESFGIGEDHEPAAMIAVGKAGDVEALEEGLKEREKAPRSRKAFRDLIWKSA